MNIEICRRVISKRSECIRNHPAVYKEAVKLVTLVVNEDNLSHFLNSNVEKSLIKRNQETETK